MPAVDVRCDFSAVLTIGAGAAAAAAWLDVSASGGR